MTDKTRSTAIPCLSYRDAPAAIQWLCDVLGFKAEAVYPGPDDTVAHAQLTLGGGMIMLGSKHAGEFGRLIKQPDEIGGCETQSTYVVVPDADATYARVKASGGEILIGIKTEEYGGRGFSCRDPGGHIWTVGTYDPWG